MKSPAPASSLRWSVFALTATAVFLVSLDATALVAAFPALRSQFPSTTPADLSWVLNGYTLVYAALLAPLGGWADRRGRKRAFLLGLMVFVGASTICAMGTTAATLVGGRIVQAVGAAMIAPASLALAMSAFPAEERPVVVSLWGATGALAAAIGPLVGSWLIDTVSWRAIFWLNVPLGLFVLQRAASKLEDTATVAATGERLDWFGAVLLSAGGGLLVFGIARAEVVGWWSVSTGATIVAGALLLCGFVAWAGRRAEAAIDLTLLRDANARFANLATLLFGACFGMMFLGFYLFMTGLWQLSQTRAGVVAVIGPLMVVPFAVLGGKLAAIRGHRLVLILGGGLYALGHLWYYYRVTEQPDYLGAWLPGQVVTGAAIGLVLPGLAGAAVARLPAASLATGNAVNQAIRQLGMTLGVALAVTSVGRVGATLADFRNLYLLLAAGGFCTALLALPIDTRPARVGRIDFSRS